MYRCSLAKAFAFVAGDSSFNHRQLGNMDSPTKAFKLKVLQLACLLLCVSGSVSSAPLDNVVVNWNLLTQRVVVSLGISNQIAAKYYALTALAMYHPLKALQAHKVAHVDPNAAAIYSAHYVLSEQFPFLQSSVFDEFASSQLAALKLPQAVLAHSKSFGRGYAVHLLDARAKDGSQELVDFVNYMPSPPGGPVGKYQFVPGQTYVTFPQLASTRPFVAKKPKAYDTRGPNSVGSAAYNADLREVQSLGNATSSSRTAYETDTALFWSDPSNTSALAGHCFNVSMAVIRKGASALETAHVFSALGVALYDGSIAAWYEKYKYLFWRPVTAIRQGDGINAADKFWTPLLGVPPEPEYTSGHASMSGACAAVLAAYRGFPSIYHQTKETWTVSSPDGSLAPRNYSNLGMFAREVALSRIYGGLHFRKSIDDGLAAGIKVGQYVWAHINKIV